MILAFLDCSFDQRGNARRRPRFRIDDDEGALHVPHGGGRHFSGKNDDHFENHLQINWETLKKLVISPQK